MQKGHLMVIDTSKKDAHLMTLAISGVMERWLLPAIVGVVLFVLGFWWDIECVEIAGLVLAAPGLWAYTVIIFVLFPIAALKHIQEIRKLKNCS
jgi:hypothetical protein